ncbi:MAG TPA: IS5 family transposase [Candidatus Acidoferrales bacterium]|nr:IS5 family transposase [Candidatus Acidoferrales bacterium]
MWTTLSPEDAVPADHPLRPIRGLVNMILADLSPEFAKMYAKRGRPSIAPEKLLRALLLQILFSVRSEPMLLEQLRYNLLFKWFVGLGMDDAIWDVSSFSKNRERFLNGKISAKFFAAVVAKAQAAQLLSDEHFTVDGTLIEAWASHKSYKPRNGGGSNGGGRNIDVDFRGKPRSNETHASTTDPDARLYRKSKAAPAVLGYLGHVLMENRNGLIVDTRVTHATGTAEREAALEMVKGRRWHGRPMTLGADKGYDAAAFVEELRQLGVTPHVAQHTKRTSAIDARTTRHIGYAISQRKRKRVEEIFGWGKTIGPIRKVHLRGKACIGDVLQLTAAALNLVRMRNLGVCT